MDTDILLKVENVSFDDQRGKALYNLSFSIKNEENVVFFGTEESGISVICPIISSMEQNFEGEIYYRGKQVKKFDYLEVHAYRKELGYLQRDYGLISNMTVEENISLPLKYHSTLSTENIEELVEKYIKELNLEHCRHFRPVSLTRSEILKTAYIRSIALDPDLLLVENALEGQCQLNVQTFIRALKRDSRAKGRSAIFVTYYPRLFVDVSDRFFMLYKGEIVFSGTGDELLAMDNPYLQQYINSSLEGPMEIL